MSLFKDKFFLLCFFSLFSTILTRINTPLKFVPILVCYIILFVSFRSYKNLELKNRYSKLLLCVYTLYCVFLLLKSIFYDSNNGILGNYVLSLFGNLEFGILSLALPVVCIFINEKTILNGYLSTCNLIIYSGIIVGILYALGVDVSLFVFILYLTPYIAPAQLFKKRRIAFLIYIFFSFLYCAVEDERAMLMFNILSLLGIILYLCFFKKHFYKLFSIGVLATPIVGIMLTISNLAPGETFFEELQDKYGAKSEQVADTRTFLFVELSQDLNSTHTWLIGKGIFGTYFSDVMYNAQRRGDYSDNADRLGTECGYLWLILKGGLIYLASYFILFYWAIIKGIRTKNKFIVCISIVLSLRLLIMFISITPRFDVSNIITWLFLIICLIPEKLTSPKFRGYKTSKIRRLTY